MNVPGEDPQPGRRGKAHDPDGVSLIFGSIFLGVAAVWALVAGQAMGGEGLRVGVPVVLIVAGLAGVLSSLGAGRRRRRGRQPAPEVPEPPSGTP